MKVLRCSFPLFFADEPAAFVSPPKNGAEVFTPQLSSCPNIHPHVHDHSSLMRPRAASPARLALYIDDGGDDDVLMIT